MGRIPTAPRKACAAALLALAAALLGAVGDAHARGLGRPTFRYQFRVHLDGGYALDSLPVAIGTLGNGAQAGREVRQASTHGLQLHLEIVPVNTTFFGFGVDVGGRAGGTGGSDDGVSFAALSAAGNMGGRVYAGYQAGVTGFVQTGIEWRALAYGEDIGFDDVLGLVLGDGMDARGGAGRLKVGRFAAGVDLCLKRAEGLCDGYVEVAFLVDTPESVAPEGDVLFPAAGAGTVGGRLALRLAGAFQVVAEVFEAGYPAAGSADGRLASSAPSFSLRIGGSADSGRRR